MPRHLLFQSLLIFALAALPIHAHEQEHAAPGDQPGAVLEPAAHWQKLADGNARFVAGKPAHPHQETVRRAELAKGQAPFAVILGCADSRVPPEVVFDQGLGDLFVVRVAGNVVDESGLASIEYAVAYLGARLVVVLGHSRCGAVEAAVEEVKEESHLHTLTDAIAPAVKAVRKRHAPDLLDAAVRAHALLMAAKLAGSRPVLRARVKAGQLKIVAARYDLATGVVEWLVPDAPIGVLPAKETPAALHMEDNMVRVPRDAVGIQWPSERCDPERSPFEFGLQRAENILVAVADFPKRVAPALEKLKALAEKLGTERPGLPVEGATTVRYYTGHNHSLHGLQTNGVVYGDQDPRIQPPANKWYTEHHVLKGSALERPQLMVVHTEKGERYVEESFTYDAAGHPIAHLQFDSKGFSFGDYGLWEGPNLVLVCRIGPRGLLGFHGDVYAGEKLAYTVCYIHSKDQPQGFLLSSITLAGATRMEFDALGRLKQIWVYDPRAPITEWR